MLSWAAAGSAAAKNTTMAASIGHDEIGGFHRARAMGSHHAAEGVMVSRKGAKGSRVVKMGQEQKAKRKGD